MPGRIRVARTNNRNKPVYPGFTTVTVTTASMSGRFKSLSPFYLSDSNGIIFENEWQFSKIYATVPKTTQRKSRWDSTVIWEHPREIHIAENGEVTEEYYRWRAKGMSNEFAVRYPVSRNHRGKCVGSYQFLGVCGGNEIYSGPIGYIPARKAIYLKRYTELIQDVPEFLELIEYYNNGGNLLIADVDGPRQESMGYYQQKYGVSKNWIDQGTVEATEENLNILLNDSRHPFGHGFCLAAAIQGINLQ